MTEWNSNQNEAPQEEKLGTEDTAEMDSHAEDVSENCLRPEDVSGTDQAEIINAEANSGTDQVEVADAEENSGTDRAEVTDTEVISETDRSETTDGGVESDLSEPASGVPDTSPTESTSAGSGSEHPWDRLLKSQRFLPFLTGFLGLFLGIVLTMNVLPGTRLFRNSALGRYFTEQSMEAANDMESRIASLVQEEITREQKENNVLNKPNLPDMSVTDIVSQYRSSVVTVISMTEDPELLEDYRTFIGSGFILNSDGMIATNYHVIQGADELSVILANGREVAAEEVNSDPETDLAIIKVTEKEKMPGYVQLGDSDTVIVGEPVVAIGSPVSRDYAGSVTYGIISGKDREVLIDDTAIHYLQTDAAINEGNSGGPLFNSRGEVIGINAAKLSEDVQGIGFAIPINTLKSKLDYLSRVPLYSGLTVKNLNPEAYDVLGIQNGIMVIGVEKGTSADRSGIKAQDILLEFGGVRITSTSQFIETREKHQPGDQVKALFKRGDYTYEATLELSRRH